MSKEIKLPPNIDAIKTFSFEGMSNGEISKLTILRKHCSISWCLNFKLYINISSDFWKCDKHTWKGQYGNILDRLGYIPEKIEDVWIDGEYYYITKKSGSRFIQDIKKSDIFIEIYKDGSKNKILNKLWKTEKECE